MELELITSCGKVRGTSVTGGSGLTGAASPASESPENSGAACRVFKGIRYARAERFAYPAIVTGWEGVYDATRFGPACFQPRSFYNEAERPEKAFYYHEFRDGEIYDYSEDCLFLNVWTPPEPENAPVLFYIHGGGFKGGCGHEKHFDASALCRKGLVVVTVNYRLGPLGFLSLPELAAEAGHTGNYGLFDQLCALKWVHENIDAFGGDPENITLMGQSAGAMSVQQLCLSPLTKGLVRQAVMLSGGGVSRLLGGAKKPEEVYPYWKRLMERLGISTLEALRAVSPAELFAAYQSMGGKPMEAMTACGPVLDGLLITRPPLEAAKAGQALKIPYLTGSTSEDMFPPVMHAMAAGWAKLQAKQGRCDSYTYFFCRRLPGDDRGAWHSSDLWYAFGSLQNGWRPFTGWDYALSDTLTGYLASFARTGNPNGGKLPVWEPVRPGSSQVMILGDRHMGMGKVSRAKLIRTMLTHPPVGE